MARPFVPSHRPAPLPGTTAVGLRANSLLELTDGIRRGLKPEVVTRLARSVDATTTEILGAISLSSSSYHEAVRKGRNLSPEVSSRVYQAARVAETAERYFEDPVLARAWLKRPRPEFGDRTPLSYGVTPEGAEHVITVLARAAHGIY